MYYTVYKITNEINGKIYIGCHKTEDLKDDYMGSGKILKRSIDKYGIENFSKKYLQVFDNPEEMFEMELKLVNADFITEASNYNLKVGGEGGFDYINDNISDEQKNHRSILGYQASKKSMTDPEKNRKNGLRNKENKVGIFSDDYVRTQNHWIGKTHTDETKHKIGKANSIIQSGKGNSHYGTMWIYNEQVKESKRIKKDSTIPDGWVKGRKMFKSV